MRHMDVDVDEEEEEDGGLEDHVSEEDEDSDKEGYAEYPSHKAFVSTKAVYRWVIAGKNGYYCRLCRYHSRVSAKSRGGEGVTTWIQDPMSVIRKLKDRATSHKGSKGHKRAETHRLSGAGVHGSSELSEQRLQLTKLVSRLYQAVSNARPISDYSQVAEVTARFDAELNTFIHSFKNATYTSTIASDLLACINDEIQAHIQDRKSSPFVCLLAD